MINKNKTLKTLLELAIKRSELEKDIKSQEPNILNHAIKIMILADSIRQNHWAGEIHGFCNSIVAKLKMNNKYPEASFYMKHLYKKHLETNEEYKNYVNNCLRQWTEEGNDYYFENKKEIRDGDHYIKITNFYKQICNLMSKGVAPTRKQVLELL